MQLGKKPPSFTSNSEKKKTSISITLHCLQKFIISILE